MRIAARLGLDLQNPRELGYRPPALQVAAQEIAQAGVVVLGDEISCGHTGRFLFFAVARRIKKRASVST
jgi:hypothetical protein